MEDLEDVRESYFVKIPIIDESQMMDLYKLTMGKILCVRMGQFPKDSL